jgi:serine/threonine protein kinase
MDAWAASLHDDGDMATAFAQEPGVSKALHFGKYEALERIGAGGMAEVFKCRLSGLGGFGKLVVVKRILPHQLSNPEFIRMFLDEARVAANLTHPNIVQTYEIDEVDGIPQISMEYVHGVTFGDLIRSAEGDDAARWRAMAAKVMAGVGEGLKAAHAATDAEGEPLHLIHRDVTPQNILVSVDGIPKLADFGVVQARGQLAGSPGGTLKGKLRYMAPEQFRAGVELDHRVDLFSAGVCLYMATTGRPPYNGETDLQVIAAATAGSFPRPRELVPDFPKELEEIILWAMAPDREARCSDGHALATALHSFVASSGFKCTAKELGQRARVTRILAERARGGQISIGRTPTAAAKDDAMRAVHARRDLGLEVAVQALAEQKTGVPFSGARIQSFLPLLAWLALVAIAAATYWAQ